MWNVSRSKFTELDNNGPLEIPIGAEVRIALDLPAEFAIKSPEKRFKWQGDPAKAQFFVECGADAPEGRYEGRASIDYSTGGRSWSGPGFVMGFLIEVVPPSRPVTPDRSPREEALMLTHCTPQYPEPEPEPIEPQPESEFGGSSASR